jgi:hypothetical protein
MPNEEEPYGSASDTTERAREKVEGQGEDEVGEDKMPPKMRKRWIHRSVEVLRDMLGRGGGWGGGDGSGEGGEGEGEVDEGENERMEVDDAIPGESTQQQKSKCIYHILIYT